MAVAQAVCRGTAPVWMKTVAVVGGGGRDALEGKGPHGRPQKRLDRQLEEVAKAVGGGYCNAIEAGTCPPVGQWLGIGRAP